MSFLGDLIGSIGGERPPAPPTQVSQPPSRPLNTNQPPQSNVSKSAPSTPSTARPVYKGTAGLGAPQQGVSLKRKAEDISTERPVKLPKPNLQSISDLGPQKPSKTDANNLIASKSSIEPPSQSSQNASKVPTKPPAKGSYAALMARAKDAQSTKAPSSIGVIKHQATEKEKIKTSKLAERKRQEQEKDKSRASATTQPSKVPANGKADPRRRSTSPVKKGDAPKLAKAPKPPLHGPRKETAPAYRGTMNQAPKKTRDDPRAKARSRQDEYLDTDEDEDSEDQYGYDDEPDEYYSDASSVMEGGFDDLEMEERRALQAAKDDDARELALENKLKKEKEDRKRKLAAMAKKHSK